MKLIQRPTPSHEEYVRSLVAAAERFEKMVRDGMAQRRGNRLMPASERTRNDIPKVNEGNWRA
jgi:hypothetical protein